MKCFLLVLVAFLSVHANAAVEVTCVCSKYDLNDRNNLVLKVVEVYTTTNWQKVEACNKQTAMEISKDLFNCKGVAKEDLR